ncbi:MAG TPA: branched-chain amino acid ABC transporter permease [Rectinema sp.]|jgi:branched-chain amino acid transport system permease protein|nr:branched-chain amino acid ABC transporter permease [Spirochaetia bacterium]MDI9427217.1 branched-chain amino acid ABC transporter permease [Spirochaetota bacterium]OQC74310.1 MAG: High-affinity branched-chain amino acid transport system permease protein LivH [Spirochaetes bacterium ADurb.Bin001]HNT60103.1 branched-chain amino acid ABC transporter permease [Rectinema sp.]HNV36692.1 branched-chain amino acid ABC transporter permease [Rectinema sp.]
MSLFFQILLDGLWSGLLYALISSGLSLIWGVLDVINFAHGEFLMVGMYVSFFLGFLFKMDPLISWVASGAFLFILGVLTYKLVIKRTLKMAMAPLLASFGLSMVLKNIAMNRFTPNFRILSGTIMEGKVISLGSVIIPVPNLVTAIFSLVILGILYWMLTKTRFGWAVQATAMDPEAAQLMGINTEHIFVLVFGLGGACVGIAGGLLPSYLATHPDVGTLFGLIAFIVVALGGFGSIPGALVAAILVGLIESFAGFYIAPVFKYIAVFGVYLVVILIRPKGIKGW